MIKSLAINFYLVATLVFGFQFVSSQSLAGVCGRSKGFVRSIQRALKKSCDFVSNSDLASITDFAVSERYEDYTDASAPLRANDLLGMVNVTDLKVGANFFPAGFLKHTPKLRWMRIFFLEKHIDVDPDFFSNQKLESLVLESWANDRPVMFTRNFFKLLKNLKTLHIALYRKFDFAPQAFADMKNLTAVYVKFDWKMGAEFMPKRMPQKLFADLPKLRTVIFINDELSEPLPANLFANSPELKWVWLPTWLKDKLPIPVNIFETNPKISHFALAEQPKDENIEELKKRYPHIVSFATRDFPNLVPCTYGYVGYCEERTN